MFISLNIYLILSCLLGLSVQGSALDDQLRLIRGSFQDGLFDLTKAEALSFLATAGNHTSVGEVSLIIGYIEKDQNQIDRAIKYFKKSTNSDDSVIRLQGYYELAGMYWQTQDYKNAADAYQAIVDENRPGRIHQLAVYWLPVSLYFSGAYQAMTPAADAVFKSEYQYSGDEILKLVFYRGQAYFNLQKYDSATVDLITVYESESPQLVNEAVLTLAQIALAQDNLTLADMWAEKALLSDANLQAITIRAANAINNEDWHAGRFLFNKASQLEKLDSEQKAYFEYYAALCESKILKTVNSNWWSPLLNWLNNWPKSSLRSELLNELFSVVQESGLPEDLLEILTETASWNPTQHGRQLAELALKEKDYRSALYWLTAFFASSNEEPDASARFVLAQLLTAIGDSSSAKVELSRLEKLLDPHSNTMTTSIQRAELYFQAGMFKKAAGQYQDILTQDGVSQDVHGRSLFRLAESYFQMKAWDLAAGVLTQYELNYPDMDRDQREVVMRRQIMCATYLQRWSEVLLASKQYFIDFPETEFIGEMYYLRGLSQANLGKLDDAIVTLGLALDAIKDDTMVEAIKGAIRQINIRKAEIQ